MEIYSMKIERLLRSDSPDYKLLKMLYERASKIKGLSNPRNTGIIHECGGKIYIREGNYEEAATDFFEAFKGYDLGGKDKDIAQLCLSYLYL